MTAMTYEWRATGADVEVRAEGDDKLVAFGYAAIFDSPTDIYGVRERVAPTAFNKTINEQDVRGLFNHDPDALLGRRLAGTLRLDVDEKGLRYEIDLPDTTVGRDVGELLRRRDITGSSFGFRIVRETWIEHEDGDVERIIEEASLRDVGPVTFPAYTATEAALRSFAEARSLPIETVQVAAREGALGVLLSPKETTERSEVDGRETTVDRERIAWLTC